jgi:nucleotide-binding universal stress UspA family protein
VERSARSARSAMRRAAISPGMYCAPLAGHVMGLQENISALERWLLAELDESTDRTGLDVQVRTRLGHPAWELAAMATELSADALVIGALARFWHRARGSVPGWLARHARCPVIIVP